MDIYVFNEYGVLTNVEKYDAVDIVKVEGKDEVAVFTPGTIEKHKKLEWDSDGSWFVMQIRGDENGTEAFEYLARNTKVEWSQLMLGQEGDKGLNIVSTSHCEIHDKSGPNLVFLQYQYGYNVRQDIHSHPKSNIAENWLPSGLDVNNNATKYGDIAHASAQWKLSLQMKSRIVYRVYDANTGSYTNYYPFHYYQKKR